MLVDESATRLIEAGYARASTREEWLARVVAASVPLLDRGLGVFGAEYGLSSGGRLTFSPAVAIGTRSAATIDAFVHDASRFIPVGVLERFFGGPRREVASATELLCPGQPLASAIEGIREHLSRLGAQDSVAINVRPDDRRPGLILVGMCREVTRLRRAERRVALRAMRHLEGAVRLSSSVGERAEHAEDAARSLVRDPKLIGDVARMLAAGSSQKQIALGLGLREGSVYRYVDALKSLTGLRRTTELVEALRAVVQGPHELRSLAGPISALPASERECVEGALRGLRSSEIAALRGSSMRTVDNLLHSAYRRLGVASRKELAARVRR